MGERGIGSESFLVRQQGEISRGRGQARVGGGVGLLKPESIVKKMKKTAYDRRQSNLPPRLAKQREISRAQAREVPGHGARNGRSEGDEMEPDLETGPWEELQDSGLSVDDEAGTTLSENFGGKTEQKVGDRNGKTGELPFNFSNRTDVVKPSASRETVQRVVLRRPILVDGAERLSLGRGRGQGFHVNKDNKVVGAPNGAKGTLVLNNGVKESEIINMKPKIKRMTNPTDQEAIHRGNSDKESESVPPEEMSDDKVESLVKWESSVENVHLVELEGRISTLELEVLNIYLCIF